MTLDDPRMALGDALREETDRRQLSHAAAGALVGVRQATWSRWIAGDNRPGREYRQALIKFLRCSAAQYDTMWQAAEPAKASHATNARLDRLEHEVTGLRRDVMRLLDELGDS